MFAAAIFDMDGLLIDSERPIMAAWIEAARALDIELSHSQYMQVVGLATVESELILASLLGGPRPTACRGARAPAPAAGALGRHAAVSHQGRRGEFLGALRERGIRCAVASSSTSGQIQACLGSLDLLHHFSAFAGGDEVARAKPDPALYLLAAERLGVAPAECIAFEDSENGAKAALAAGMRVVVVPDLKHPPAAIVERAFMCSSAARCRGACAALVSAMTSLSLSPVKALHYQAARLGLGTLDADTIKRTIVVPHLRWMRSPILEWRMCCRRSALPVYRARRMASVGELSLLIEDVWTFTHRPLESPTTSGGSSGCIGGAKS
jgi:beta-phosphoglucomutase-like phosphatase (HAD superfamily)